MKYAFAIYAVLCCLYAAAQAQQPADQPPGLEGFRLLCFATCNGPSPDNIIRMDNNDQILRACVGGKTLAQLDSLGIRHSESQIQLLLNWDLLEYDGATCRTLFPIIDRQAATRLRAAMDSAAAAAAPGLAAGVRRLAAALPGHRRSLYTVLFSYVLDDLTWRRFEARELLPKRELSIGHPFWGGVVWAIVPSQGFVCGTNSVSNGTLTLCSNWSKQAARAMGPLGPHGFDRETVSILLDDVGLNGRLTHVELLGALPRYGIFDRTGRVTVPIIDETASGPLADCCRDISAQVADSFIDQAGLTRLRQELPLGNEGQALVIAFHEYMWSLLERLEAMGLVEKPLAFRKPEKAKPKDIGDLIFIIKQSQ